MKKRNSLIIVVVILIIIGIVGIGVSLYQREEQAEFCNEETAVLEFTEKWISQIDQKQHTVSTYSLGTTEEEILEELDEIELVHKYIDDISVYEMYPCSSKNDSLIFFIHGKSSRKEEYLYDMVTYADEGYVCVTIDIEGCGERISDKAIMSIQATVDTGRNIDTLIEYYMNQPYANTDNVAIVGLSHGGSIAYWYAAYGRYPLSALVVGSTTPNYLYYIDDSSIKSGVVGKSIWTETEIKKFINENNPVNNIQAFDSLPILSGHGMEDPLIGIRGDEELEQYLYSVRNENAFFYYFDNVGHDVPEEYIQKILPFINEYLR